MKGMPLATLLFLLLAQNSMREEVDRCLEHYPARIQDDDSPGSRYALLELSERLTRLGPAAFPAIGERLAGELRRGGISDTASALYDAVRGHPEAAPPLQIA